MGSAVPTGLGQRKRTLFPALKRWAIFSWAYGPLVVELRIRLGPSARFSRSRFVGTTPASVCECTIVTPCAIISCANVRDPVALCY